MQQIAATVEATWQPQDAIVVIDALTNNLYQTRTDPAGGIAEAEPIFKSMLQRLGIEKSEFSTSKGTMRGLELA